MEVEKRFFPITGSPVRLERRGEGEPPRIVGMAPPYGAWSPVRGDMREMFEPGAFEGSEEDVIGTVEHDDRAIFGRMSAGTLKIEDRAEGAFYSAILGTRTYELDLIQSIERGEIRGSSFEFIAVDDEWSKDGEGIYSRVVRQAIRLQVGPVARPFYDDAAAALRSLEAWRKGEVRNLGPTLELLKYRQRHLRRKMEL